MRTLIRDGNEAFIVLRSCLPSLYPKFFPYRTLLRGIRNMVDKLFFRGELFALRCSFMNLPMLCPIFIGSLFYEGFYTKDGLDFPLAHGYRFASPTSLGPPGPIFGFYSLQLPPSPHLVCRYLRKGIKWGDSQTDSCWWIYVHGLTNEIQTRTVTNFS